jgi:hypothetical protein
MAARNVKISISMGRIIITQYRKENKQQTRLKSTSDDAKPTFGEYTAKPIFGEYTGLVENSIGTCAKFVHEIRAGLASFCEYMAKANPPKSGRQWPRLLKRISKKTNLHWIGENKFVVTVRS